MDYYQLCLVALCRYYYYFKLPHEPSCPSVGWLVSQLVGQSDILSLNGKDVTLPCSYQGIVVSAISYLKIIFILSLPNNMICRMLQQIMSAMKWIQL